MDDFVYNITKTDNDISITNLGDGLGEFIPGPMVIDNVNNKLLVAVTEPTTKKPGLLLCNLDGSSCIHRDISAGQGSNSGYYPSLTIDTVNSKILVVTLKAVDPGFLSLFRCNMDGTGCTHTDISAEQNFSFDSVPDIKIDTVNSKILVATYVWYNPYDPVWLGKPGLFRCNLDGSGCTHTDISAGLEGTNTGHVTSMTIDYSNSKILVISRNEANDHKPVLFRCNLDGTGCTNTDLSFGQERAMLLSSKIIIDSTNSKILVVANVSDADLFTGNYRPGLIRCDLDTISNCSFTDLTGIDHSVGDPEIMIDSVNSKLLVVTSNPDDTFRPYLMRCTLTGSGCSYTDVSPAGSIGWQYNNPKIAIDSLNSRILIVTSKGGTDYKPHLYRVYRDYVD